MKNHLKSILMFVSLMAVSSVWAAPATTVTAQKSSKAIMVTAQKPEFSFTLPTNPSTGFNWYVKYYPTKFITPVSSKYNAPDNKRIGAGGTTTFTFKVNPDAFTVAHLFRVKLVYAQAWNIKDATPKTMVVVTQTA